MIQHTITKTWRRRKQLLIELLSMCQIRSVLSDDTVMAMGRWMEQVLVRPLRVSMENVVNEEDGTNSCRSGC